MLEEPSSPVIYTDMWVENGDVAPRPSTLPTWCLSDFVNGNRPEVDKELTPFVRRYAKDCYFIRVSQKAMICVITLANNFDVRGESACIEPENFDAVIGAKYALRNAVDKASAFIAYIEQEKKFNGKPYETDK